MTPTLGEAYMGVPQAERACSSEADLLHTHSLGRWFQSGRFRKQILYSAHLSPSDLQGPPRTPWIQAAESLPCPPTLNVWVYFRDSEMHVPEHGCLCWGGKLFPNAYISLIRDNTDGNKLCVSGYKSLFSSLSLPPIWSCKAWGAQSSGSWVG